MTDIQNYSNIVNDIFGVDTATLDLSLKSSNKVIAALNNNAEYFDFIANFKERLKRLKRIYLTHPEYLQSIIIQVNEIASYKNWEGAFAELAAFDHLNQDILGHRSYLHTPIKPNVTINKSNTFALELGKNAANLDGFVEDYPLYFDVKCFKDIVSEILEGIYKQLKKHLGNNDFLISSEHALDVSYNDFQKKRKELLAELKTSIIPDKKTRYVKSSILSQLSYRILWGAGIQTTERTYEPFSHAENYHKLVFNFADKFVKDKPTLIVFVVFPWYNLIVSKFSNNNTKLYRALSRRFFCQYKHDTAKFKSFNSEFTGDQTMYQVSNNLSGIVFLEDNSILSKEPNKTNVNSFVYLNPNAVKPLSRSLARHFIMGFHHSDYDDFENDNY